MILLEHVSKQYGLITALSEVSAQIDGGIVGLLGPNGAGKSTALKLVTGYLGPSSGRIRVLGHDPRQTSTRIAIGYLPEGAPLPPEATIREVLDFAAQARLGPRSDRCAAIAQLSERLDLGPLRDRSTDTLSKGQRRRVALAAALLGDPPVLILDEPTDGLDPNQRDEVHALIRHLAPTRTVLVSTHILDEAERLCDRALILAQGRLLADDTPTALARRSRHHNAVRIEFSPTADSRSIAARLSALPSVLQVEAAPGHRRLTALARPGQRPFADIASLAATECWAIEGLHLETGRLEDVFRALTSGEAVA